MTKQHFFPAHIVRGQKTDIIVPVVSGYVSLPSRAIYLVAAARIVPGFYPYLPLHAVDWNKLPRRTQGAFSLQANPVDQFVSLATRVPRENSRRKVLTPVKSASSITKRRASPGENAAQIVVCDEGLIKKKKNQAAVKIVTEVRREEALLKAGALQSAIFNSANFSSIATDEKGVIQIFNVGAERMLGYTAAEVMNKITPADISDPQEVIARAKALSVELGTPITPGFEALVFKASRGIEDI